MICIICKQDKDKKLFSKEHIIPESIGGTITIDKVCKECNDYLGSNVDHYLTNHWFIAAMRLALKITGKSGKLPNPIPVGKLVSNPKINIQYLIDSSGMPVQVRVLPLVEESKGFGKTRQFSVSLDASESHRLPEIVNKKLKRMGLSELSEGTIRRQTLKAFHHISSIRTQAKIDTINFQRAIIKIAYELGHYCLGDAYFADSIGENLRLSLIDERDFGVVLKERNIIGNIIIRNGDLILSFWDDEPHSHICMLKKDGQAIGCYIRIFNIFEAMVTISETADMYPEFEDHFVAINVEVNSARESRFSTEMVRLNNLKKRINS